MAILNKKQPGCKECEANQHQLYKWLDIRYRANIRSSLSWNDIATCDIYLSGYGFVTWPPFIRNDQWYKKLHVKSPV